MLRDWALAESVGKIREVIAYSKKNYWTDKPAVKGSVIPKTFDWDLFLNRAEMIPFSESYMNREWIRYAHFSGAVGDMAAHIFDPAYYALDSHTAERPGRSQHAGLFRLNAALRRDNMGVRAAGRQAAGDLEVLSRR